VKGIFKFFIEEKNIFFVHTTVLSLKTAFNLVKIHLLFRISVSSKEKQVMGDIITSSVRGEQPSQLSSIMPPHSTSWLQLMPPTQYTPSVFRIYADIQG
jgi:hypothetical protein